MGIGENTRHSDSAMVFDTNFTYEISPASIICEYSVIGGKAKISKLLRALDQAEEADPNYSTEAKINPNLRKVTMLARPWCRIMCPFTPKVNESVKWKRYQTAVGK